MVPYIETIPHMLPDDLREEKDDLEFMKKFKDKIPKETLEKGKPFHI